MVYFVIAYAASSSLGLDAAVSSVAAYVLMIPLGYFAHRILTLLVGVSQSRVPAIRGDAVHGGRVVVGDPKRGISVVHSATMARVPRGLRCRSYA